jgi:hypothetical protein
MGLRMPIRRGGSEQLPSQPSLNGEARLAQELEAISASLLAICLHSCGQGTERQFSLACPQETKPEIGEISWMYRSSASGRSTSSRRRCHRVR